MESLKKPGSHGYPLIYVSEIGASGCGHRIMWFLSHGFIPIGKCVMHSCDNKMCINPKHLILGTHETNLRDMRNRGRAVVLRGEQCGTSKLKDKQIQEIRGLSWNGLSYSQIAKRFKIHNSHVSRLVRGLSRETAKGQISSRLRRVPICDSTSKTIVSMRIRGEKWVKIALACDVSRSAAMRTYFRHMATKHSAM